MYTVKMNPFVQILISAGGMGFMGMFGWMLWTDGIEREMIPLVVGIYVIVVGTIFYCIRVKVRVYIDYFTYYPLIGRKKTYRWQDIGMTELKHEKLGDAIKIYDKNGRKICYISASFHNQRDFVETVQTHQQATWKR